jgi:hypothetical protein
MNNQKEVWLPIKGYEGAYEVSNLGKVKSLDRLVNYRHGKRRIKGFSLNPIIKPNGYLVVNLYKNSKLNQKNIHQLIAETFLNHIPNGHTLVVDHINNIKSDNRLENLQVITHRENMSKDRSGVSKYTGVHFNKQSKKWKASINVGGKVINLGSFDNEDKSGETYKNYLVDLTDKKTKELGLWNG